jgi:hypothetical protein
LIINIYAFLSIISWVYDKGAMIDKNEKSDHAVIIKQQIDEVLKKIERLKKGAPIYWLEETAEAMLLLRSFNKSGRWAMLNKHAYSIGYDAYT